MAGLRAIAVTGGTGFIGERLITACRDKGIEVRLLTRSPARGRALYPPRAFPHVRVEAWTPSAVGPWVSALAGVDAVVHLAGSPIAGRWTPAFKREILQSREQGTRTIVEAVGRADPRPRVFVSASACRFYGPDADAVFSDAEDHPPGKDYLAQVCVAWEREAARAESLGVRRVTLRFSIALGMTRRFREVLEKLRPFLGGRIGSGRQWASWVHRDDAVAAILRALEDPAMRGTYNVTSPHPVRMDEATAAFGEAAGSRFRLPVPSFVLEGLLGDGATILLDGQRVIPARLTAAGFAFRFPEIKAAVRDVLAG
ncbi:MAG: TIGR01777 family oxidoreductase [Elioraea sp.]|nr:TIGR01777 family oxidoreductase [Elioraea sp.]